MGAWEGYLTVKVVEGRKIKMVGDKQADPYVVLSVGAVHQLARSCGVSDANLFFFTESRKNENKKEHQCTYVERQLLLLHTS